MSADAGLPTSVIGRFVGQSQLSTFRFGSTYFVNNNNDNSNEPLDSISDLFVPLGRRLFSHTCKQEPLSHISFFFFCFCRVHAEFKLILEMRLQFNSIKKTKKQSACLCCVFPRVHWANLPHRLSLQLRETRVYPDKHRCYPVHISSV